MLKYGLPFVPARLMFWVINSSIRFILNAYTSLENAGIYSMMNSVSSIFALITVSIGVAWFPYAMAIAKKCDAREIYARMIQLLLVLLIPLAFIFWSISDIIILTFSRPVYLQGEKIIIIFVFYYILCLLFECVSIGLNLKEKNIYITIGYAVSSVVAILMAFPLCKYLGILGAGISMFIGNFILVIIIGVKAQKYYYIPYRKRFVFFYIAITLCILIVLFIIPNMNLFVNFIVRFIIGCCYLIVPFLCGMLSIHDIKNLLMNLKMKMENNKCAV
jgi:O-antigen/teichoic acid export membrane protein